MKSGKDLLRNVKHILEKELAIMVTPVEEFHVSRYLRKMEDGVDIEVLRLMPVGRAESGLQEEKGCLRIKKPLRRRELAHALKEILGWN